MKPEESVEQMKPEEPEEQRNPFLAFMGWVSQGTVVSDDSDLDPPNEIDDDPLAEMRFPGRTTNDPLNR